MSLSPAPAKPWASRPKKSKYGNKPTQIGAEKYRSQREAKRHRELIALERAGQVAQLRREVPFELAPAVRIDGRKRPALRYVADFVYLDTATGAQVIEDAKGVRTEGYRIKRHLMAALLGLAIKET